MANRIDEDPRPQEEVEAPAAVRPPMTANERTAFVNSLYSNIFDDFLCNAGRARLPGKTVPDQAENPVDGNACKAPDGGINK